MTCALTAHAEAENEAEEHELVVDGEAPARLHRRARDRPEDDAPACDHKDHLLRRQRSDDGETGGEQEELLTTKGAQYNWRHQQRINGRA
jgi:hypothetical protein